MLIDVKDVRVIKEIRDASDKRMVESSLTSL